MPSPNVFDEALQITRGDTPYHIKGWHHALTQLISAHCDQQKHLTERYVSAFEHRPNARLKRRFFVDNESSVCATVTPDSILMVDARGERILMVARYMGTSDMLHKTINQWHSPHDPDYAHLSSYIRNASDELMQKTGVSDTPAL